MNRNAKNLCLAVAALLLAFGWSTTTLAQGVTTASMSGFVTSADGSALIGANVVAVHEPSGTRYGASTRDNGQFNIANMRIGGPYTVTVDYVGYTNLTQSGIVLNLAKDTKLDFALVAETVEGQAVNVTAELNDIVNSSRTGAATYVNPEAVANTPSVRRSTRDLTKLDPRSDGNFSFGGKNWLYNNISLDGSYFNNPFGLDDPAPGGQAGSEPIPFESVEQVQVSLAPFDVREGGFTGAGINTVTKSGTNNLEASFYSFTRNESFLGNTVSGQEVVANPDLAFNQSGFTLSGPIIPNKLFFFINGELERRDDPGTNFAADEDGNVVFGESRVSVNVMNQIRDRMMDVYGYDTGPFQGYINETNSDKFLGKLDWNANENNSVSLRVSYLDAARDLPPNPVVLSFANSGRGPNSSSLPFQNSGYRINNELLSSALEWNSRSNSWANRFFASYNRFRDFREANSTPFPTVEIGEGGVTYTTLGHEPFSINNVLDQDVLQITNNASFYSGNHVVTIGTNFEYFSFFNSFNIFRHGVFFLPPQTGIGSTFSSLDEFFRLTDPNDPDFVDLNALVGSGPFKGEDIEVGQIAFYAQDEYQVNPQFNLTMGLRVDIPMYFTDPVDNPFSRGLTALDEKDRPETVDQSELPGATPLWSPRVGFNFDAAGDGTTQLRGGTGIFTGRIPFVWAGNVISNPGNNPNLFPNIALSDIPDEHNTSDDAILQTSFDLNAMAEDFKWPQVWTTNLGVDQDLGNGYYATLEGIFSKDINAIYMRNADLVEEVSTLNDGRPYYGGAANAELNPDGGSGIYVIDNTDEGYNYSITTQLRKNFQNSLNISAAYTFLEAKSQLRSTEIASVLWQGNPVQGDPNNPQLSFAEFGNRHRVVAAATYSKGWTPNLRTHFGLFFTAAQGNSHTAAGGNRYSFIYSGDVNGDGQGGNDLIYIPNDQSEIILSDFMDGNGNTITSSQQWTALNAFIEQDDYLSENRGKIAERFGLINPWYNNLDLRLLQDISFNIGSKKQTLQLNVDVLNVGNLINSDQGVRKIANPAALSPLQLVGFNSQGEPIFNFTGPEETFLDDPSINSRWQVQVGLKYFFR